MNEYCILGHSNATLCLIIDTLLVLNKGGVNVEIVSNIPVPEGPEYSFDGTAKLKIRETRSEDWPGEVGDGVIMGAMNVETKEHVYRAFRESHGIDEQAYRCLVHPAATIAHETTIGHGAFIGPGCIIAPYATIGSLTTINRNVSIGHHTAIGDFCTLNPGCNVAGNCVVESRVAIAMGANVIDGLTVGENARIGACALVTKPVPGDVVVYGIRSKVIR